MCCSALKHGNMTLSVAQFGFGWQPKAQLSWGFNVMTNIRSKAFCTTAVYVCVKYWNTQTEDKRRTRGEILTDWLLNLCSSTSLLQKSLQPEIIPFTPTWLHQHAATCNTVHWLYYSYRMFFFLQTKRVKSSPHFNKWMSTFTSLQSWRITVVEIHV